MKVSVKLRVGESETLLKEKAKKELKQDFKYLRIVKKSLDARNKGDVFFLYNLELSNQPFIEEQEEIKEYSYPTKPIVIVGFGPSGIFSALRLSRAGFKVIVVERGSDVDRRKLKTDLFFNTKALDTECNIQFGEGGAGTFSDGKLNTGVKGIYKDYILNEFVKHGAPLEIKYLSKPHIGSDILPKVVKSMREEIISLGGEVLFDTLFTDFTVKNGKIESITVKNNGKERVIDCEKVILAIGHSSRDTYKMLYNKGVFMEEKETSIGFRVEHLQTDINKSQFGKEIGITADYKTVTNVNGRGVFSFCMCPGGVVVPAMSEENTVVTNGMSEFARDKINANSAIICQIRKGEFYNGILESLDYFSSLEQKAFCFGGGDYSAPVQNVEDFIKDKKSTSIYSVKPTYAIGVKPTSLNGLLPDIVTNSIRSGLVEMGKKINCFSRSGILTGVETRTSSPVRIVRNENLSSVSLTNLYPVGEVGYAGGITSSAMDGIKVAEKIKELYQK
ncbi:MAG: FAD-dependent oxidoreductase [Clostridia bacterium]|nr:FAD-dependent oxidoreductase [Clostridia bacterium]